MTDVDRVGSLTPAQLAAAYGTTKPTDARSAPTASNDNTTNGWQIAALGEAAVLRRPSRSAGSPSWRAASTALPTWGCRGAHPWGGGAARGPALLGAPPPASRSRHQGTPTMLTRRIVASACALCLAVPAAAGAKDVRYVGHAHHAVLVATGDTKSDLPGAVAAVPPGDTKGDLTRTVAAVPPGDTKGDLPRTVAAAPPGDTKCDLPRRRRRTTRPSRRRPRRSRRRRRDDATNGWRLAAVIEGGLLAAFAIGAAVVMTGRRHRAPRMGV